MEVLQRHAAAGPAVEVEDVAVLRQGPQRAPLAGPADQDRNVGLLEAARGQRGLHEAVVAPLEVDGSIGREQRADQLARLLEAILPLPHRRELPAVGLVLPLEPGGAQPEDEATVRDVIDRRRHLRDQRGIAIRVAEHEMPQAELPGHAGRRRDEGEPLVRGEVLLLPRAERRQEVIREPEAAPAAGLQRFDGRADVVPGGPVAVDLDAELHEIPVSSRGAGPFRRECRCARRRAR
jgi:hypothetical protein